MYLVGDADRERGLALLRRHYADGRLTMDELSDRAEAVGRARTTEELRRALRDLPLGVTLSTVAPRAALATAAVRTTARVVLGVLLLAAWACVSLTLLAALGIALLVAGASSALVAGFTVAWAALSWLLWRLWRAGSRPHARAS